MGAGNWVLGIVGVVALVISMLSMVGVGAVASVVNGPPPPGAQLTALVAKFTWQSSGLRVNFSASNSLPTCPSICAVPPTFSAAYYFGDSIAVTCGTNGTPARCTTHHTYGASGSYTVTEIVREYSGPTQIASAAVAAAVQVPSSSTGTVTSGFTGASNAYIAPSFQQNATGLTATFIDTSAYVNETAKLISWSFGDGINISGMIGKSVPHRYATGGTYLVTLTITGAAVTSTGSGGISNPVYTASQNITVQPNSTSGPQNSNPYQGGVTPIWYTANNVSLAVFGAVLTLFQVVPVASRHVIAGIAVTAVATGVTYFTVLFGTTGAL